MLQLYTGSVHTPRRAWLPCLLGTEIVRGLRRRIAPARAAVTAGCSAAGEPPVLRAPVPSVVGAASSVSAADDGGARSMEPALTKAGALTSAVPAELLGGAGGAAADPSDPGRPVGAGAGAAIVRGDEAPAPAAETWSCVYVARTAAGWFYVGESDGIAGRVQQHRRKPAMRRAEFAYWAVTRGGKSAARRLETALIRCVGRAPCSSPWCCKFVGRDAILLFIRFHSSFTAGDGSFIPPH